MIPESLDLTLQLYHYKFIQVHGKRSCSIAKLHAAMCNDRTT